MESADSDVKNRIKITCTSWTVRRTPWLRTSHQFKGVGEDVKADRSHEVRTRKRFSQAPGGDRGLLHRDKEALFEIRGHLTQTMHLQFLDGHGEEMVNGLDEGWMRVSSIMDSGAAESVSPPTICPHIPLTEAPGSRTGQECRTAGGERLRNSGQRHIQAWTDEGCPVGVTYQVADVTKPLNPVSKMCDAGNVVTFTAEGGIIKNLPWDPTGLVRDRADGGHHDGEHVIAGQISSEDALPATREQTPRSVYITSDFIRQYGPQTGCPECRSVASRRPHESDSATCTCLPGTHSKDLSEMTHHPVIV